MKPRRSVKKIMDSLSGFSEDFMEERNQPPLQERASLQWEKNNAELPEGWEWKTLGEACTVILGQSPESTTYNTEKNGLPFFQGKAEFGPRYPTVVKWCSHPKKVARKDDILMSVRAPVGPTNFAPSECCIGRGLAAIRPTERIDHLYVFYYLRKIERELSEMGTGTTFKAISGDVLRSIEILLAPIDQQKLIVTEIEKQFSRLDEAVAALKRIKANLKRYKASVLKAAVEGKLTEEWRQKQKKGKSRENADLPEDWQYKTISDIGEVVTGTTPPKSKNEYYESRDYPFFKPTDLNAGFYVRESADWLSKKGIEKARLLPPKSILVTCIGATIGKTGLTRVTGTSNQQINTIIPKKNVLPEFIYFSCIAPQFQKSIIDNASATTLPILNKRKFELLTLFIPSRDEQQKIIEEIESRLSVTEEIEETININLKRAERLRQAILKKAFEGKLI
jgi:type I restriction enzyme S subunit